MEVQALQLAIIIQAVFAELAAEPAQLPAGEVGAEMRTLEPVDPDGAGLELPRDALRLVHVRRVEGGPEPGVVEVRARDHVGFVRPGQDWRDGGWWLLIHG